MTANAISHRSYLATLLQTSRRNNLALLPRSRRSYLPLPRTSHRSYLPTLLLTSRRSYLPLPRTSRRSYLPLPRTSRRSWLPTLPRNRWLKAMTTGSRLVLQTLAQKLSWGPSKKEATRYVLELASISNTLPLRRRSMPELQNWLVKPTAMTKTTAMVKIATKLQELCEPTKRWRMS